MTVPAAGVAEIIIAAIEMPVFEQQAFHAGVVLILFHAPADDGIVDLVEDLVTLQVDTPVGICRNLVKGLVRLDGQNSASLEEGIVPYRVIDLYFRGIDRPYQPFRIVLRVANADNYFVAYREKTTYGGLDGIVIFYGVSNK